MAVHYPGDTWFQRLVNVLTNAAIDAFEWLCEDTSPNCCDPECSDCNRDGPGS